VQGKNVEKESIPVYTPDRWLVGQLPTKSNICGRKWTQTGCFNDAKATGNKVLVCAEMTYQVEMGKTVLVDPLPEDIRRYVVWRDTYWLPDEAASIYARSLCVVSVECHSPLISLHQGTPTCYVRQPTDTCKGEMYRDIGAGEWLFEVDETDGAQLWSKLEAIRRDPAAARAKVQLIMSFVEDRQTHMAEVARNAIKI